MSRSALDRQRGHTDVPFMQAIISVLAQLAWGVTIGGLTAAVTTVAQGAAVTCGVAGCGYLLWRRRRRKRP
jgi:hypothetical protein